ncbi:hypothetical protein [Bacteroides graminisolvens]|uniref:hypothetical protein n=1 Tax=Bacteroides graminisolvens TaxID=477666 RepID=UPI000480CBE2|nr:hypothetical protein [Bacteroides graminisolvens]
MNSKQAKNLGKINSIDERNIPKKKKANKPTTTEKLDEPTEKDPTEDTTRQPQRRETDTTQIDKATSRTNPGILPKANIQHEKSEDTNTKHQKGKDKKQYESMAHCSHTQKINAQNNKEARCEIKKPYKQTKDMGRSRPIVTPNTPGTDKDKSPAAAKATNPDKNHIKTRDAKRSKAKTIKNDQTEKEGKDHFAQNPTKQRDKNRKTTDTLKTPKKN